MIKRYGFFRRRLENDDRADDLVQETLLAVIRAPARYEPRAREHGSLAIVSSARGFEGLPGAGGSEV